MIGRREFALTGLSAFTLAALQNNATAEPLGSGDVEDPHGEHREMFAECARACSDCQRACDACSTHCTSLILKGHKEHARTLASCQDCADVCAAAAQIVARGGPMANLICTACAAACADCAKMCEAFPGDIHMKECAAECRKCEKACRAMITQTKASSRS